MPWNEAAKRGMTPAEGTAWLAAEVVKSKTALAEARAETRACKLNKHTEAQKNEASARAEAATTHKQLSDTQQRLVDAEEKASTMQKREASARKQLAEEESNYERLSMTVYGEGGFEDHRYKMKQVCKLK